MEKTGRRIILFLLCAMIFLFPKKSFAQFSGAAKPLTYDVSVAPYHQYKVHYDINQSNLKAVKKNFTAGQGDMPDVFANTGASATWMKNQYSINGYDFVGWNTKPDGSGVNLTDGSDWDPNQFPSSSGSTISIYAQWRPSTYHTTLTLNDAGSDQDKASCDWTSKDFTIESDPFSLPTPSRRGYYFTGWIKNGSGEKMMSVTIPEGTTGDQKYTATWAPINYTVKIHVNGGKFSAGWTNLGNDTYTTTYTVETNTWSLPSIERDYYDFTGWTGTGINGSAKTVTIEKDAIGDREYWANFAPHTYTISYTLNGGGDPGNPTTYNVESNAFTLKNPTKTGYTFTGWTGSNGNTPQTSVTIPKGSYGDKSYTANWTPTPYSISYNLNGGSVSGNPTTYNIESNTITLKNPTRTGYTFTGWTGSNGNTPQKSVTIPNGSTGNKSYTANWKVVTYSISYDLKGGSLSGQPTSYNIETESFTLKNPTKTGYTFTGWTGSNGNTPQTTVTIPKGSYGNKSYTANWKPTPYSISYNLNGGSISGQPTSYNIETESFTLKNPTRTGYTFTGWTGSNGNTPQTSVTISKGSYGNRSYTANWTPTPYSITYNLNGGSVSGNPMTYNIETESFTLKNPTRTGYTFTGWTESNGGTSQTSVTIPKGSTGNKSYTANWKINSYTVDVNDNYGGSNLHGTFDVYVNGTLVADDVDDYSASQPYGSHIEIKDIRGKTGYDYTGVDSGSTDYNVPAGNSTTVLHFDLHTYTISYVLNGGSFSDKDEQPTSYHMGETKSIPQPSRSGYVFAGWIINGGDERYANVTIGSNYHENVSLSATWQAISPKLNVSDIFSTGSVPIYCDIRVIPESIGYKGDFSGSYISKMAFSIDTHGTIWENDPSIHVKYVLSAYGPDPHYGWDGTSGQDGSYAYAYNKVTSGVLAPIDEFGIAFEGLPSYLVPHVFVNGVDIRGTDLHRVFSGTSGDLGSGWWYIGFGESHSITSLSGYIENTDIVPSTESITL